VNGGIRGFIQKNGNGNNSTGAEPCFYYVPYMKNTGMALQQLQENTFRDGNYRGSDAKPPTIEKAVEWMKENVTASILDITGLSKEIVPGKAAPLEQDDLLDLFGSDKPNHTMIENNQNGILGWMGRRVSLYYCI
jgi:hypothetical protein